MPCAEIDQYIEALPEPGKSRLKQIRALLAQQLPEATECFKWQMPTLHQYENLLHFASFKNHIGIFPGSEGVRFFESIRSDYPSSKGTIQIGHDREIPFEDLRLLVAFRLQKAQERSALKQGASSKKSKR